MAFHFAWVDASQTSFSSAFTREDEQVLSFELAQEEGDFASLRLEVRNPRVGLLSINRKRWGWLSVSEGATLTPLFFGRLIGLPEEMNEDVVTLSFIAKPLNYQVAKATVADTMRQSQYFDPLFIEHERRLEPDTVLEARPMVWHIDRVTHAVTASHVLTGEDGTLAFGDDAFADSVRCGYSGAPQRKVVIEAQVRWTQYGYGTVPLSFAGIRTYTGDGLLSAWPKKGQRIGGGWTVAQAFAKDAWSKLNTETINDRDGVTKYILYKWTISGNLDATYEAERSYTEVATFTLQSGLQEIVTESGDEESIALSVSGDADEPVDVGNTMPIGDLRRRAYFTTERGHASVAYLANIAAARLLASARCVEISFEVPFSHAASLSLRKSGSILDPRLPGGGATGKIKSYTIFADGSSGETGCRVTLGCTPGDGGSLMLDPGTPGYVTDYVDSYQVYSGATQVLLTNGAGDAALTISNFDGIVPNDDGLDLFNMTTATTILSTAITNPAPVQKHYVYSNSQDTNAALTKYPTKITVNYRPVKGGPFRTDYEIECSALVVPKTIDLEATSQ
jgi:hypothetical protein